MVATRSLQAILSIDLPRACGPGRDWYRDVEQVYCARCSSIAVETDCGRALPTWDVTSGSSVLAPNWIKEPRRRCACWALETEQTLWLVGEMSSTTPSIS